MSCCISIQYNVMFIVVRHAEFKEPRRNKGVTGERNTVYYSTRLGGGSFLAGVKREHACAFCAFDGRSGRPWPLIRARSCLRWSGSSRLWSTSLSTRSRPSSTSWTSRRGTAGDSPCAYALASLFSSSLSLSSPGLQCTFHSSVKLHLLGG